MGQEARATYKNAKRRGVGQNRTDGLSDASKDKVEGDGRTLNGFNRRTELTNRCYKCDSEHHLAPKWPRRDVPKSELGSAPPERDKARKLSYSAISKETPVPVRGFRRRTSQRAGRPIVHMNSLSRPSWK